MRLALILTALSLAACDADPECLAVDCACTSNDTCRPLGPGSLCVEGQCRLPFDGGGPPDGGGMDGGGDDAGFDAGFEVGDDAGVPDGGTSRTGPPITVGDSPSELLEPELGCLGSRAAPPMAEVRPTTYRVAELAGSQLAQGAGVWFYADNVPRTSCPMSACQNLTSDAAGTIDAQAPTGGWIAYYSLGGQALFAGTLTDVLPVAGVNMEGTLYAVPVSLRDEMTASGLMLRPDASTLMGQVFDCSTQPIANAVVRLFEGTREIPLDAVPTGPRAFYWDGSNGVDPMAQRTSTDGRWGVTNVGSPRSGSYRVELWGARDEFGPLERIGCENVPVVPDGFGVVDVGPQRIDGPC